MDRKERQARLQREEEGYTPSDGVAWSDARHSMSRARLLTDKDPRAIEPPHFRGELYAPQQTMLAAMLALEARPYVAVGGFGQHPTVVQTRSCAPAASPPTSPSPCRCSRPPRAPAGALARPTPRAPPSSLS
jgi:hypothetical protein